MILYCCNTVLNAAMGSIEIEHLPRKVLMCVGREGVGWLPNEFVKNMPAAKGLKSMPRIFLASKEHPCFLLIYLLTFTLTSSVLFY